MAEFGTFRTSLSGFNKKDVLDYIDELQKTHAEELAVLQEERDRLFQENQELAARESESAGKVSQAEENADRLTARVEDLQRENARIQNRWMARFSLPARSSGRWQIWKRSGGRRKACNSAWPPVRRPRSAPPLWRRKRHDSWMRTAGWPGSWNGSAGDGARQRTPDRRIRELEAENRRYDELVGDVGSLVMEVRSMGQRFLDTACRRGESGIEALEEGLASMEGMLQQARDRVEETRSQLREQVRPQDSAWRNWSSRWNRRWDRPKLP